MSTRKTFSGILPQAILLFGCLLAVKVSAQTPASMIGREVAIPHHLQDGDEYQLSIPQLIAFGEKLFTARWTIQEGENDRPNVQSRDPNWVSGSRSHPAYVHGGANVDALRKLDQKENTFKSNSFIAGGEHGDPCRCCFHPGIRCRK